MKLAMFGLKGQNDIFSIILVLGLIIVIAVLVRYNTNKSVLVDTMAEQKKNDDSINSQPSGEIIGASASDIKNNFMPVSGIATQTPQNSCNAQPALNPSELLPNDTNSEWANINPASNDLKNLNLLNPQQVIGINTVGSSLRNANLQVRSEPAIPKANVGPWNASTIETDTFRRPLEIGGCD
jgi:hypothetical protein